MFIYQYCTASGDVIYEVVRKANKKFQQRRPDGKGGHVWNLDGVVKIPYRLPELLAGVANGERIFIAEGEKDVERLRSFGLCATTISGGAKENRGAMRASLPPEFAQSFTGAKCIVIFGDNDKAGDVFAQIIAEELVAVCPDVRIVSPIPGAHRRGYDISDWLDEGATRDDLLALADAAAPFHLTPGAETQNAAESGDAAPDGPQANQRVRGPADRLVDILLQAGITLFHDSSSNVFATYTRNGHQETASVLSTQFKRYCQFVYYKATTKGISSTALSEALNVIAASALFDGILRATAMRCARDDDTVYIDLANDQWEVAAVSPSGYRIIPAADCPIPFVRRPGMLPLPTPVQGGTLHFLDRYLPTAPSSQVLIKAFMVAAMYTGIPMPVLHLTGPQGAGKSTVGRRIRALVDPNRSPLRSEPREVRDVAAAVSNNHLCAFDNISRLPVWLSDVLCRLATGGGFAGRELYTNDDEHVVDGIRPVLITAIENVALRGDLADRVINVSLHLIDERTRETEAALDAGFEADRPLIFGALLDALSTGLLFLEKVDQTNLGRMADFEILGRAASPAFGVTPENFADIYHAARITTSRDVTEASPLTEPLRKLAEFGWTGTFKELFTHVVPSDERERRDGGWPRTTRGLSPAIQRLIPDLRAIGIEIIIAEPDRRRSRLVTISKILDDEPLGYDTTSATSATSANGTHVGAGHADVGADDADLSAEVESPSRRTSAQEAPVPALFADVAGVADDSQGTLKW